MYLVNNFFEFLVAYPIVMVGLAVLPFFVLARWRKIFPTKRLLVAASVPVVASLITSISGEYISAVLFLDAALVVVLLIDLTQITSADKFSISRTMDRVMSLGKSTPVTLELVNNSRRRDRLAMIDDYPEDFTAAPPRFNFVGQPRSRLQFEYELRSSLRGLFRMQWIYLKVRSLFGFWEAYYQYSAPAEINVYPDLKQISEYGVLARTNRLSLLGVRRTRKIGSDNEFERLRDYTRDDNHRHIDWRATARKRKLIVRDFQLTQNQNVIFLVDCGRMMTGHSGKFTMLDHALNAMLLMSYVALRQGDAVGLLTFSDKIHDFTPPKSGTRQVNRLLHATFDRHADYVESRYDEAFLYLNKNCRKRSLVVLITNVIDEVNASQIQQYLKNASGRHLALAAVLRDRDMFGMVDDFLQHEERKGIKIGGPALFQAAAAAEIIRWRQQAISSLTHAGILCIDCYPEQLTSSLVNRYLEIKARHLL